MNQLDDSDEIIANTMHGVSMKQINREFILDSDV